MVQEEKLDWKKIPLSKVFNPRETLDKRPLGHQYGKRWELKNDIAHTRSMFGDKYKKH